MACNPLGFGPGLRNIRWTSADTTVENEKLRGAAARISGAAAKAAEALSHPLRLSMASLYTSLKLY